MMVLLKRKKASQAALIAWAGHGEDGGRGEN